MSAARFGVHWNALWLAMLAGVALQLHERALGPVAVYAVAAIAGLLLAALAWCVQVRVRVLMRAQVAGVFMAVIAGASFGFGVTGWQASARLADALPATLEDRDLQVTGVVAGLPQVGPSGLRFVFEIEQALRQGQAVQVPGRVVLGWYSGFHEDAVLTQPQTELRAGQRWRFTVRLRQPHGNLNPHGFDYELQLFEQGIRATGQVRDGPVLRLADAAGYPVQRLRQGVRDAIQTRLSDRRAAGVLAALAVGDQAAIERDDWALFRQTGVAHLMSISGLHVTMFAWLAGALIGAAWRRSGRLMAWLPGPTASLLGGLGCALAYAVFAGWGVPAQRTVWMLATVAVLRLLGLRWPWPMVLLGAAVVVAVFDPWALLQPGFWLSFAAVGLLMASEPAQRDRADVREPDLPAWRRASRWLHRHAWGGLRTQAVATIGLAPLTLLFFQQLSLVGFVANLVAIPLVTLVITPLALLGSIAAPLWSAAAWALQGLTQCLAWFASWPGAVWTVPAAPGWAQAAALLAALLLLAPLPWRVRLLALPLALPLLWPPRVLPAPGQFELLAADVGQGTAVLVRTRGHLLVYDAGPVYSRDSNAGQRVLLPLLRARGETRIDTLLLSHRDADHVGGARALIDATPVGELLSSLEPGHPLLSAAAAIGARTTRCESGQAWDWDGVRFTLLHPQPDDYLRALRPNAVSCVLRVEAAGGAVALLTGDIEREQEQALVAAQPAALRADVLMAPHHGSKTSSTPAFLSAVRPTVVVVQSGHHNRFGHPAAEVLQRYVERGTRVQASPACGAWRWLSANGIDACERQRALRYWHHGASLAID